MKKIHYFILSFALMLVGFAPQAGAQSNALKINILSPIVKTFNVAYERKLNADASFQLGFFYTGYSADDTKFRGIGITPEYRFYLSETEAIDGVYVAPFVRYQNFNLEDEATNSEGTLSTFGGGVIIGHQWVFKERITLDTFIGPQYLSGSVDVKSGTDTFDVDVFDGFGLRLGLTLGVAF